MESEAIREVDSTVSSDVSSVGGVEGLGLEEESEDSRERAARSSEEGAIDAGAEVEASCGVIRTPDILIHAPEVHFCRYSTIW